MAQAPIRIAVLGAGLQGTCVAFALADRGAQIDLYERNNTCLAEASAHNEGKLHLGFVYAKDETFATACLMARGALNFERLMRRWIGNDVDGLVASSPFVYVVHREGLVTPDAFARHCRKVSAWIAEANANRNALYFGTDMRMVPERLSDAELSAAYRTDTTAAAFRTKEIGIDPEVLAQLVRVRVAAEPSIRCLTNRTVIAVNECKRHLTVLSAQNGCSDMEDYDYVVNTLWSGRLAIDAQLGLLPRHPWSFRFKYFVRAATKPRENVPSTTIVLGPFGDVVNYADGTIYLSWYPAGLTAWSKDVVPPNLPATLKGPGGIAMRQRITNGLASVIPGVAELALQDIEIKGGWIFASGDTDIDDPNSELHQRCAVGPYRQGRYLSVNTGKLTVAPLFAQRATELMLD